MLTIWRLGNKKIINHHLASMGGVERRVAEWPGQIVSHGTAYGVLAGATDVWRETRAAGFHWLYVDGPYWLARKNQAYRMAWDWPWFNGRGPIRIGSLKKSGADIEPWRTHRGDKVIVAPNSHIYHDLLSKVIPDFPRDADVWARDTAAFLQKHTDREIVIRKKKFGDLKKRISSMKRCLADAWALVTSGSTFGVEAICRGVPVFTAVPCAASPMAESDLTKIESPRMPDGREEWAMNLAARQFSVTQIQSGEAWRVCEEDLQGITA